MPSITSQVKPAIVEQGAITVPDETSEAAIQLTSTEVAARCIAIAAHPDNTAVIYIGKAGVTSLDGFPLAPGAAIEINAMNITEIYVISETVGQDCRWMALGDEQ